MSDAGFFKTTTFGGFDKKAVLTYIDSLNEKFQASEQDYQEKLAAYEKAQDSQLAHIQKLEAHIAQLEGQLSDQNGKLETVAEQLELDRQSSGHAQALIGQQAQQIEALEKKLGDCQRELEIQLEQNRQLQFRVESLDFKSKKYDEISTQVGNTLIEARQNAERITASAELKAKEMAREAQERMKGFYGELSDFKGDAARLRKCLEDILFQLNGRVDTLQEIVEDVEKRYLQEEEASPEDPSIVNLLDSTEAEQEASASTKL